MKERLSLISGGTCLFTAREHLVTHMYRWPKRLQKKMGCSSFFTGAERTSTGETEECSPSAGNYQLFCLLHVNIIFHIHFRLFQNLNMVSWNLGIKGGGYPFLIQKYSRFFCLIILKYHYIYFFSCRILLYS